jgi:hypothetical protein
MMNPSRIGEFARPFNASGEKLEEEEKLKARVEFWALVDDVLLAHMSEVTVSGHSETTDMSEGENSADITNLTASYCTSINEHTSEGRYLRSLQIVVSDKANERSIHISEEDRKGTHREVYYCSSTSSLDVLRVDKDNDKDSTPSVSEDTLDMLNTGLKRLLNEGENYKQEVAMGLNNQPVSSEEITQLRQLLIP